MHLLRLCPSLALLIAASLPGRAATVTAARKPAPIYVKPPETVLVTAERAPVLVAGRPVATATRGRCYGVRKRAADRVAVQVAVGTSIRTGWLRAADVRTATDDDVDFTAEALKAAKAANPRLDLAACRKRLDALAAGVAAAAEGARTGVQKCRAIGTQLFRRERFRYQHSVHLLDDMLERRAGNCMGLSVLYLCVAERLKMPLYLVAKPNHAFLRYDDGTERFSIEPSMGGVVFRGYLPHFGRRTQVGGVHYRLLSKPRAVGLLLTDLGSELGRRGKHAEACRRFARAIEIGPEIAEAYCDWGVALARMDHFAPACDKFARSLDVHPGYSDAYAGWGAALGRLGRNAEACHKLAKAVALNPRDAGAYFNWGSILIAMGKPVEAVPKLERAVAIRPSYRAAVEELRSTIPHASPGRRKWGPDFLPK